MCFVRRICHLSLFFFCLRDPMLAPSPFRSRDLANFPSLRMGELPYDRNRQSFLHPLLLFLERRFCGFSTEKTPSLPIIASQKKGQSPLLAGSLSWIASSPCESLSVRTRILMAASLYRDTRILFPSCEDDLSPPFVSCGRPLVLAFFPARNLFSSYRQGGNAILLFWGFG